MKETTYTTDSSVNATTFGGKWLDYLHNNTVPLGEKPIYDPVSVIKYSMRKGVGIITEISYGKDATRATKVEITLATDDFANRVDEIYQEILSIAEKSKK